MTRSVTRRRAVAGGVEAPDELARLMATTQPNVSRIERGGEMELSTLRTYIEALGGRLEIAAVFDDERFPVTTGTSE